MIFLIFLAYASPGALLSCFTDKAPIAGQVCQRRGGPGYETLNSPSAMDSSVALLRSLFLVAPRKKRCSEKTGDEYHPNNQRPR